MAKKKTHEQFIKDFMEKNPKASDIEVLGQYVNNKTKIKCKCKIDGHEWTPTPHGLLQGQGCPLCSGNIQKTHEEFVKELEEINSDIEILGQYVNVRTKIEVKCKIDGNIWEVLPSNLLKGKGCPKCSNVYRRTHEEFVKELEEINNDIEVLGTYINAMTKIEVKCKIDGHIWEVRPKDLLNKQGCPKCSNVYRRTHEEFVKELEEINNDIEVLGQFKDTKTKIEVKCKVDGYIWEVIPSTLLSGGGCPKCNGGIKLTHEEFIEEFMKKNSNANNIEILEKYVNAHTKIKCKCKNDGHIWKVAPYSLLKNVGCPLCSGNIQKTHEEFVKELEEINSDIEILGQYVTNKTKIKCKCKKDEYIWEATPNNLLSNSGCPKCNSSKGEKRISKYLEDNEIDFISQHTFEDCKCKQVLPFDFYIPSLNMAIEYDGRQHFEIVEYFGGIDGFIDTKIRDSIKTWYCKKNDIKLIRIPYWNFDSIEEILEKELEKVLTLNK